MDFIIFSNTMSDSTKTEETKEQSSCSHHDVTVVGGGWSGLVACKYMLEEGLSVVALEKRDDIGGVWLYSDNPHVTTVMRSTQCTSSSTVTEMSDYPMSKDIGMFPHHSDVMVYLRAYAEKFRLLPHVKLNTEVKEVKRERENWKVTTSSGEIYTSRFLVVAAGNNQTPNRELEETCLRGFTGRIFHASEIKYPREEFRGQRLLVVGGGETGGDICMDWIDHAEFIYWSIPRGQHFFRKYAKVVPWGTPQALDKASSRMLKSIAPYVQGKPGLAWVCKFTTSGSLLAYQGHGIPEWKNDSAYFHFFMNKNGKVLDLVDYKKLVPKGGIVACEGKKVTFQDGTKEEFDLIVTSTGYKINSAYLPERYADVGIRNRHKMVFDVEDPSIAFIGLVRPIVGSIVGISELQARWAAKTFAGKLPLKSFEERNQDVQMDKARWSEYFKNSSQRIEGLVEGFTYVDDIARHADIYPDYWSLFKKNPRQWVVAYFSPYNASTHRLNEPDHVEQAISTMKSHKKGTLGPVQYLLIMFLRLIWFDVWLDKASEVKYRIQTSQWWQSVRMWRLIQALNYIWTLPKRVLFDNTVDDKETISERAKLLIQSDKDKRRNLAGSIPSERDRNSPSVNGTLDDISRKRL